MTGAPILNRPPRPRSPLPAGDIAILAIVIAVLLGVVVLGGLVLWDSVNPIKWTANGWAAVGTWFAGFATIAAVWVALRQSKHTREDAKEALIETERRHREQLREEALRSDLAIVVNLLPQLTECASRMFTADFDFAEYRVELERGERPLGSGSWPIDPVAHDKLIPHMDAVRSTLVVLRSAYFSVRTSELRTELGGAVALLDRCGELAHTWLMQAANGEPLSDPTGDDRPAGRGIRAWSGALSTLVTRAESKVVNALERLPHPDLGSDAPDQHDASITA